MCRSPPVSAISSCGLLHVQVQQKRKEREGDCENRDPNQGRKSGKQGRTYSNLVAERTTNQYRALRDKSRQGVHAPVHHMDPNLKER